MYLVVGLGNPGPQYVATRHNVGFLFIDYLQDYFTLPPLKPKFQAGFALGKIDNIDVALLKPLTFMNLSGQSVQAAAHFFKIPPEKIIVCHDEMDIPFGTIKTKCGGGNAGHNGLKNISQCLGTNDFQRLRIGIGRPPLALEASQYVLSILSKSEQKTLGDLYEKISCFFNLLLSNKMDTFIQKIGA